MKILVLIALPLLASSWPAVAQTASTGDETRAQAESRALALFNRLDADGDGVVTRDEMAQFAAAQAGQTALPGSPLPPAAAAMFDDADSDHDGKITRAEAIATALRGFDQADTNHDGKVTAAERHAAMLRVAADLAAPAPVPDAAPPREIAGPPAPQ